MACAWLVAIFLGSPAMAAEQIPYPGAHPFEFAVIGDVFTPHADADAVARLLSRIGETHARFIVDVGSLKTADEGCDDPLLPDRVQILNQSILPLVTVAANNEWIGCPDVRTRGDDGYERLEALRQDMFATSQSLGQNPIVLARESGVRQFHSYAENARWESGHILFVTLNLPAGNNDFRLGAGRNGEFEDRAVATRAWLERSFHYAELQHAAGVVVCVEADPDFNRPLRPPDHRIPRRDGFYEFKLALRDEAQRFHGQVLLIHNSNQGFLIDEPLPDATNHIIRNFTRVRGPLSLGAKDWLSVTVDVHSPRVFSVQARDVNQPTPEGVPSDTDVRKLPDEQ